MAQVKSDQIKTLYPEIPSDLPLNVPAQPGKPLAHRYDTDKFPQNMIEPSTKATVKLASEVNFKPVTIISIANKSVYVKPVSNIKPRNISPYPSDGSFKLPIRGERVIDLSTDTEEEEKRRLDKKMAEDFEEPKTPTQSPDKKPAEAPNPPVPTQPEIKPEPKIATIPTQAVPPPSVHKITPPVPTAGSEAKEQTKEPPDGLNSLIDQLHQEQIQKTVAQKRVLELSDKYQSQLSKELQEKNRLNSQIKDLKNKLIEETKSRMARENVVTTDTNQLKTETNQLKIERDGLLGQLKEAQNKLASLQDLQAKSSTANVEITRLKAKLAQVEKEKEDTEQKSIKLEGLLSELKGQDNQAAEVQEIIIPKEIPDKSKDTPVRIVHPTPAIGKMAPQLTTIPNVVSGIVKDKRTLLLSDVIILVKDSVGNPVRALKSNKIGQFAISTPLPNGTYTMELEKENNDFDVVQINLEGKVMPPIEIRAR